MRGSEERFIRKPFVAGQFYEAKPSSLRKQVEGYINRDMPKKESIAIVAPHAGFIYSGAVAGSVYSSVVIPERLILLGPNHTGLGASVSVYAEGLWETPIHNFKVDAKLAKEIIAGCLYCKADSIAHNFEHSLEVHLPFIACLKEDVRIVPIAVMRATLEECASIGHTIAEVIKSSDTKTMIIASSDMSHYVSEEVARSLDALAIEKILAMDPKGLYEIVFHNRISMCGVLPVTIMLFAANALGAKGASLVRYSTSAEISGDFKHVVGYAGIVVF